MSNGKARKERKAATENQSATVAITLPSERITSALAAFCKNAVLSPADERDVTGAVSEIRENITKIKESYLVIGENLHVIHAKVGAERFSTFAKTVLPTLGIPRSTAYRFLTLREQLALAVPNQTARKALLMLTDGKGIFVHDAEGKASMTGAYQTALRTNPMPRGTLDEKAAEMWAATVQQAAKKAGKSKSTEGERAKKLADRIFHVEKGDAKGLIPALVKTWGAARVEKFLYRIGDYVSSVKGTIDIPAKDTETKAASKAPAVSRPAVA